MTNFDGCSLINIVLRAVGCRTIPQGRAGIIPKKRNSRVVYAAVSIK